MERRDARGRERKKEGEVDVEGDIIQLEDAQYGRGETRCIYSKGEDGIGRRCSMPHARYSIYEI